MSSKPITQANPIIVVFVSVFLMFFVSFITLRERKAQRLDTNNAVPGEDAVKRDSGDLLGSSEVRRKDSGVSVVHLLFIGSI